MKKYLFILIAACTVASAQAQRVHFSKLEMQKNGLFYQINTIPPFTGTAFEVHPPEGEKQKEKATNDYEAYLRSAQKMEEVEFKAGKTDGKALGWDQFGQKVYQANFVAGVQQGQEQQWYPNGQKKVDIIYLDGVPNGMMTEWYMDGAKKSQGEYTMGREQGLHSWWYKNGNKDQEITYATGLEEGAVKKWYEDGSKMLVNEFQNGERSGTSTEWYKNGQKKAEGTYVNGKEDGKLSSWDAEGKLLDVKIYKAGELIESMNYRSGGIRNHTGFVQIFNEMKSFFKMEVKGTEVKTINTGNIGFVVDGKILQMISVPLKKFQRGGPQMSEQGVLEMQMRDEMNNVRQSLGETGIDVFPEHALGSTANGREYLHWYFKPPIKSGDEKKARTVREEHYLSTICGDQILVLSSIVTNSDKREDIIKLLKDTAETIEVSKKRIDMNAVRAEILGRK